MPLPFVVSRYLRPFLQNNEAGVARRVYDNGVTGRVEQVDALEDALLQALWDEDTAEAALLPLLLTHGQAAVQAALLALHGRALLFERHADADELWRQMRTRGCPDVPFVDQVELTNRCPMHCPFCPRGVPGRMARPTGMMDLALFQRLLLQLPKGQADHRPLELHHLGESLLHPQVAQFVAAASQAGVPTEMSVNPALLTPPLAQALLAAGIHRLVLSLDGIDDGTLVAIRGPAARYSRAAPNIDALLAQVAARGQDAPRIVIQMIDLAANRGQQADFLRRYGTTGLPTVTAYVKPLDGPDPTAGDGAGQGGQTGAYLCSYPSQSVVVLWDGRVVPCCRDDDARLVLGDLNQQTLAQIWAGPAARDLRRRHRGDAFPAGHLCQGCAWGRPAFVAAHRLRHPGRAVAAPLQW